MIWLLKHQLYGGVLETCAVITIGFVAWWVNGGGWGLNRVPRKLTHLRFGTAMRQNGTVPARKRANGRRL